MSTKDPNQAFYIRSAIKRLHQMVSKEEEDKVADQNPKVPIIMGDFTNWQPKPFYDIVDYFEAMYPQFDKEQIIQKMHFDKVLPYRKSDPDQFTEQEMLHYKSYICELFENYAPESWKQMLTKFLLYKKPHLVNAVHTREDYYHKLHVMFAMFKVGRHEFLVRAPKLEYNRAIHQYQETENLLGEPDYFYYSNVSDIRPEEVHPFVKQTAKNSIVRLFVKEKSVF